MKLLPCSFIIISNNSNLYSQSIRTYITSYVKDVWTKKWQLTNIQKTIITGLNKKVHEKINNIINISDNS